MAPVTARDTVELVLREVGITITGDLEERQFPGEHWYIAHVGRESLPVAQSLAGAIEKRLNADSSATESSSVIMFRPAHESQNDSQPETRVGGRLAQKDIDQLIQLFEARSRTSDALPSLQYMEDPRASLAAVGASRHHLIYGRRGVGKTALLLEAKRRAESAGYVTVWLNAHPMRKLTTAHAFAVIAERTLSSIIQEGGSSSGVIFERLTSLRDQLRQFAKGQPVTDAQVGMILPELNDTLRSVLRDGLVRVDIFLDDFYLIPIDQQPYLLDYVSAMLRDCDGWLKAASIERLTRPFEPSSRHGMEIPHDATSIDLDVTLEDPRAAQTFLESVVSNYFVLAGITSAAAIAKREALGRLVLASGGVPRDYLNLFASSIVVARESRGLAQVIGREDVAIAAGRSANKKKRDLEQDVASHYSETLLASLDELSSFVKARKYTYFRVNADENGQKTYEQFAQLVDTRFVHLVNGSLSDQHRGGTRYECYILDLSEFSDVRLKRGLNVLDLDRGQWTKRLTGTAQSERTLAGTALRDALRQSPLVDLSELHVNS